MKTILLTISLITSLLLSSCQDQSNIVVSGQITDSTTGKPIAKAEVVVLCWYKHGMDNESFDKITLKTDQDGKFQTSFKQGHQVDVAAKALDYQPSRSYNTLNKNEIVVNLSLDKIKKNPTLQALLTTDHLLHESPYFPYLRVRIPGAKNGQGLDFNNGLTFGFDFKTLTTNSDTTQADFWYRIENQEGQPATIASSANGGLIPIFKSEIKSSSLYEKSIAPETGYVRSYTLTGKEEGFFVRCRDGKTYAKVLFEKSTVEISSPDGKGSYYKEFGKDFHYLYQPNGTRNLTYPKTDFDLEEFLIDARLR